MPARGNRPSAWDHQNHGETHASSVPEACSMPADGAGRHYANRTVIDVGTDFSDGPGRRWSWRGAGAGVGAVVVNATVTEATEPGFVTVFSTGVERPLAWNLNSSQGLTIPNLVVAKLGAGRAIELFNSDGGVHLLPDVAGWSSGSWEHR